MMLEGIFLSAGFGATTYLIGLCAVAHSWRKIGGIYHWRLGRFGGSFYQAKPRTPAPLPRR